MDNKYSMVLLGNGLDLALGKETKVESFLDWLIDNKNQMDKIKRDFSELKFPKEQYEIKINKVKKECYSDISDFQIDNLYFFIDKYSLWCEKSKLNKTINWSSIENNIVCFFNQFENNFDSFIKFLSIKKRAKEQIYEKLRSGFEVFSFLMQIYYIKELKTKPTTKTNTELLMKLEKFLYWLSNKNIIISLNYTNFYDFVHPSQKSIKNIKKQNIHFLHYIGFGTSFYNYVQNLNKKNKDKRFLNYANFGDASEIFKLSHINIQSFKRKEYIKPHFINKSRIVKKFEEDCKSCGSNSLINPAYIKKYYQLLILGSTETNLSILNNEKYMFLRKDKNENLFMTNYPDCILENIKNKVSQKINRINIKQIYIFGYSFGISDKKLNDYIINLIKNNGFNIKIVFFKKEKSISDLLKNGHKNYNDFLVRNNEDPLDFENYKNIIEYIS